MQPARVAPQGNGGAPPPPFSYKNAADHPGPGSKERKQRFTVSNLSFYPGGLSAGTGNWNFKPPVWLQRQTAI
jgi:hypothetical protein